MGYFYFIYDSPQEIEGFSNLSISAEFNNQKIKTGYMINTIDGIVVGNTSQSYEKVTVKKGQTINISNINIAGQSFFKDSQIIEANKDIIRVDLRLEEPTTIDYKMGNSNPVILNISSVDARDIKFCLRWSFNYIFVEALSYNEIENFEEYKNWDKCYTADYSLKNSNKLINISYREFAPTTEKDFIEISLIQEEFLGIKDQIIKIK